MIMISIFDWGRSPRNSNRIEYCTTSSKSFRASDSSEPEWIPVEFGSSDDRGATHSSSFKLHQNWFHRFQSTGTRLHPS